MKSFRKYPYMGLFALSIAIPNAFPGIAHAGKVEVPADSSVRTVGPQADGSIVASDNQLLTPVGKLVSLGSPVRAKALAVNPNKATKSAAVLLMSAAEPIVVFNTKTGDVIQRYIPSTYTITPGTNPGTVTTTTTNISNGSFTGITYSSDGSKLLFSQDNNYVQIANVDPFNGTLSYAATVPLPKPNPNPNLYNSSSINAGGLALFSDTLALVALNANNTLGIINLQNNSLIAQVPVGNAPNHVAIKGDHAYVTNEGGRLAGPGDFTNLSDGANIVADPTDAFATTGTVSVVDLATQQLVKTINVGLHPAGLAVYGSKLYVANSYSDTISVIDTDLNKVVQTISVGVPIAGGAFGAGSNDIAIAGGNTAYVTLGQSNAIAVVDLTSSSANPVLGYIPTAYFPTSISYDATNKQLVVADDKGLGAQGSIGSSHGVDGFNTHQDTGVVNLIPVPTAAQLATMTKQVISNNNWNSDNVKVGSAYANPAAAPVAVPAHIGEPSLIKHVFLIIKENRTYDQMLGDVAYANGDPSLAIFSSNVPNQHALIQRFPLLDNVYAPSRQSADGHPWIVSSGSFYSNDILSPDWIRSYPGGNSNDALTYTQKGFLWSGAIKKGLNVKMYGEWSAGYKITQGSCPHAPTWVDFYNTAQYIENGTPIPAGSCNVPFTADSESSAIPSTQAILDPHYPSFNLGIPDQYRMDYYLPILAAQDAANNVPNLTIIWLPNDHTNGTGTTFPLPANYEADNDLALGRLVEAISKTNAWPSTAIFVEEDDAQDGVDHVDGHRQPVYVASPYTVPPQATGRGQVIHTTYTAENINRTIENILGLEPLTQFDLTASPMFDVFQNTPNTTPWAHVPATTPLNVGSAGVIANTGGAPLYTMKTPRKMSPLEKSWMLASLSMTKGKEGKPDSVDEVFLNHVIWYSATNFKRPYPGEARIQWPDRFVKAALHRPKDTDGDGDGD